MERMAARRILQLGDPVLRAVSPPVTDWALAGQVLADLRDTLHEFQRGHGFGRGISAVQIGQLQRILYLEFEGAAFSLCNPVWEWMSEETFEMWDDCFSFPDLMVRLRRSLSVRVSYLDQNQTPRRLEATGALSELLQHEMDHLDGILAIDRALDANSLATRAEWLRQQRQG